LKWNPELTAKKELTRHPLVLGEKKGRWLRLGVSQNNQPV
jgi:hypothetical protein